ncbi:MAG: polysaccharide biosynthesis tyrosine autokinase [Sphingobacteriales bacterium]|nr:MAG: polysaccharide biosynthesis tyrosine autokinase [Sphingobacteriales bacterium]
MSYLFKLNDQSELVNRITKSLKLDEAQNINLLYLKLTDHNPYFAVDILNAILREYLNFDKSQRSVTALQTANFISSLLQTMADTVSKSGLAIQKFRQDNKASTIPNNIDVLTDRLSDLQSEKETIDINHLLISSIEKSLNTLNTNQLIYNLESITDTQLSNLLIKYNELVIYRKRSLDTYTENSAIVKQLDRQIVDFRDAISDNIFSQRNRNNIKATYITKQIDSINMSLADVPKVEREFVNLQASFDINQKVYSYLSQKKLEAEISGAAVTPGAVIIDKAVFPEKAIAPIPKTVYTLSILASLMSMVIIIYFVRTFNPYIYGKGEIEDASHTPIIGIIRKYRGDSLNKHSAITTDPRSLFSESVRSVRSNLGFFGSEAACKTICIISEISGEGKSFISTNLAISMTLTEKKVLLIAADLRKSKLHDNFQVGNVNGLSKFLSGQSSADEIVVHTEIKNLDLIPSGPVPPNPSELLHSQRMQQLLDNFKGKYDYILIDSAPVGLVTDGKPLLKMADITLFILRSGVSKRFFASTPDQLKTEMNLSNIAIILNDFEERKFYSDYYANAQLNITHRSYYHPSLGKYNYEDYLEL